MPKRLRQWTHREFCKVLKNNGFHFNRQNGDHHIYLNANGRHISVPMRLNACIALRLIKENNLKID